LGLERLVSADDGAGCPVRSDAVARAAKSFRSQNRIECPGVARSVLMRLDTRSKLLLVLSSIFTISLVVGDILGGKLIQAAPWGQPVTLTVGMIPFPITFLLTDVINEFYGKRAARFITVVGFVMALLSYLFIGISAAIPIAPITRDPGWKGVTEEAFNNVFMSSRRMIAASLTAYLVSQFTDI